jgi:hypothetical protein
LLTLAGHMSSSGGFDMLALPATQAALLLAMMNVHKVTVTSEVTVTLVLPLQRSVFYPMRSEILVEFLCHHRFVIAIHENSTLMG